VFTFTLMAIFQVNLD